MKSLLTLCLGTELLLLLMMIVSAHYKWNYQALPYLGKGTNLRSHSNATTHESGNINRLDLKRNLPKTSTDKLVENFEQTRKNQLDRLNVIRDIHPMTEKKTGRKVGSAANAIKLPASPRNLGDLKQVLKQTFWELQPSLGIVWFNAFLEFPAILRILAFIPPIGLPLIFLYEIVTTRKSRNNEYQIFLKSLRGLHFFPFKPYKSFDQAYELWKKPSIQGQFWKEKRSLRKQWFRALVSNGQEFDGLNFGSALIHEKPSDIGFSEEICQLLIQLDERIDRRFSALLTWYLDQKGTAELAQLIYERTLRGVKPGELDHTAKSLLRKVASLWNHPDLRKQIDDCT